MDNDKRLAQQQIMAVMQANRRAGEMKAHDLGSDQGLPGVFRGAPSHDGAYLLQALAEERWHLVRESSTTMMWLAEKLLDMHYPADLPLLCDRNSPDPGPRLAAALRDCIAAKTGKG